MFIFILIHTTTTSQYKLRSIIIFFTILGAIFHIIHNAYEHNFNFISTLHHAEKHFTDN